VLPDPTRPYPGYALTLADGARYTIRGGDLPADRVVQAFAVAGRLLPAGDGAPGHLLLAITDETEGARRPPIGDWATQLVCTLPPPTDQDMLAIAMTHLTLAIAHDVQRRGGLLVHGALAAWPAGDEAMGVLFAAPGSTGKSTASRRLPPPWHVLCDDTTLLVCNRQGRYYAHPTPTWSRFYSYSGAVGGRWAMQESVPLRAIFFLSQAPADGAEVLPSRSCATALLAESADQVGHLLRRHLPADEAQQLNRDRLTNVEALAHAVPAWRLHVSLNGAFWNHVERALAGLGSPPDGGPPPECPAPHPDPAGSSDAVFVVYTGPSMNPTLAQPDVLEVVPYTGSGSVSAPGSRQPCAGDVIYFVPAGTGRGIVHRVMAMTPQGIRTRGDNNPGDDPDLVQLPDVVGRVVAAHRGSHRRRIAGGWPGQLSCHIARWQRALQRPAGRLLRRAYRSLHLSALGHRLLPGRLQPRVVRFEARRGVYLKLLLGDRLIGHYDTHARRWIIRLPFRLLVDEAALPQPDGRRQQETTQREGAENPEKPQRTSLQTQHLGGE
jgi:SynChlorMet cassette protein ScmC